MLKVITHAGTFHADEVLAIATLAQLGLLESYERSNDLAYIEQVMADDPNTICLDIGRKFDGVRWFDHHQDPDSPATNVLVLRAFCADTKLVKAIEDRLFTLVSEMDCGRIQPVTGSFSSVISNFNQLENGFEKALEFAGMALEALFETANKMVEMETVWDSLPVIGRAKVQETTDFIPNWKDLAERDGLQALISPNQRGGWQVISYNSEAFNIPPNPSQTFRHNSGFLAVYPDKESAVQHYLSL